jgi:dipeptidyl aminopeptidase/acylaminoacyl peptidase
MKLWIYLPAGKHEAKSLPCVFIAPAGSNLMTGIALADGDRLEHLPYARAGFAVCAYELDGVRQGLAARDAFAAIKQFVAAHGGVDNARTAIDYVLARLHEIDAERLYVAGHSSAGTVALDVAAAEPRIKACCSYAGYPDLRKRFKPATVATVNRNVEGFDAFLDAGSPVNHAAELKSKPVFLFSARDDTNTPTALVEDLASRIKQAGGDVKLVVVESGGHYRSMIDQGIPSGIEFLKAKDAKSK